MPSFLTKEQILDADDLVTEIVEVPEWGGSVIVRGMTGAERDNFEASVITTNGRSGGRMNMQNVRAKLVSLTVVNEDGKRLFTGPADVKKLGKKSAQALNRVFNVAQDLSGITSEDVEELTENLESGPSADFGSDSA